MKNTIRLLLLTIAFCAISTLTVLANSIPYFTGGAVQTLSVCQNSSVTGINALLAVIDSDSGQTETWQVVSAPVHGSLSGLSTTATSTGSTLTPSGIGYMPTTGYAGTDTFTISINDGTDADTLLIAVTVIALPNAGTISGAASVCVRASTTFTTTGSGGFWASSNATASVSGSGVVTGASAGLDTISYIAINSCGTATAMRTITILPLPTAGTLSGRPSLCVGDTTTYSSTVGSGFWSTITGRATISGSGLARGVSAGADTVRYTVINSCGSAIALRAIVVNPLPASGTITGLDSVCEGATTTLTDSASGGTWAATNSNAGISATGTVTGIRAGLDTIHYTVTNTCGTSAATFVVRILPAPVSGSLTGVSAICRGRNTVISSTGTGGAWSLTNTRATLSHDTLTAVAPGWDTVLYTVTNSCGTATAMHAIRIDTLPVLPAITGRNGVCRGTTTTLHIATTGGTWVSTSHFTTLADSVVTGVAYGRDTITYIATNICGADTAYHLIRVDTIAPRASVITGPTSVCVRDSIALFDSTSGGIWRSLNTSLALVNPAGHVLGRAAGTVQIMYKVGNSCGLDSTTTTITVRPLPNAGRIIGLDSVCQGSTITLRDSVAGGRWSSSESDFASVSSSGIVTGNLYGSVIIRYVVTNSCGTDTATHRVDINIPVPPIAGDDSLCIGSFLILTNSVAGGTWSSSNILVAFVVGGYTVGYAAGTTTITYSATNACGTTATTHDVHVYDCTSGIAEPSSTATTLSIVPNPNQGNFILHLPVNAQNTTTADMHITNLLGQTVFRQTISTSSPSLPMQLSLPKGIYTLSVTLADKVWREKVVVE